MDAVYKGQGMWTGTDTDKQPLGYRNIYDEYRTLYSSVKGLFPSGTVFLNIGLGCVNSIINRH